MLILGSGPNRIGQGIEFDYSCVHASMALRDAGYCTVMVNCNPETVSTDYDTSDRLYFEPLTCEDVLEIVYAEMQAGPVAGVIVQLGGQTPLGLAQRLADAGVPIVGTSPEAIHLAEERGAFGKVLADASLPAPKHGTAMSFDEAQTIAAEIGFPVLVRPSYVLGGRGMEIVYSDAELTAALQRLSGDAIAANWEHPVLIDRFLDDAVEIDVDGLYDGDELFLGGVMEHIEEAGVHSGDSSCALPPITLGNADIEKIRESDRGDRARRRRTGSAERAVRAGRRRALRAGGEPAGVPDGAVRLQGDGDPAGEGRGPGDARGDDRRPARRRHAAGRRRRRHAADLDADRGEGGRDAVQPVPDHRRPSVDTVLGPEMRSTGEVMGIDDTFGTAFAKSQAGASQPLPGSGKVFVSVANRDKRHMIFPVKRLADLGFQIYATEGTADVLRRNGVEAVTVRKSSQGPGPNGEPTIVQMVQDGELNLIVNTPIGITKGGSPRTRRLRDPQRGGGAQHPVHHHGAGAGGGGPGDRGSAGRGHRSALAAGLGCAHPRYCGRGDGCRSGIAGVYRKVVRPVLYRLGKGDAEVAHEQTLHGLRLLSRVPGAVSALSRSYGSLPAGLERTVFGVRFPGPVGLAAGMDKNGVALPAWRALGFGFVEVGTVTAHPQPGNEKPRLFRLVESEAVINRMGFNNLGSAALADRLAAVRRSRLPARDQHREVEGDAARGRGRGLRHLAAAALPVRRLLRGQREFAEHAGVAVSAGLRAPAGTADGLARRGRRR